MLCIVASCHCIQFEGKWQIEKMAINLFWAWFLHFWPTFWPQIFFSWISPLLNVRYCCKLSLYPISRKTNESNLGKWQKNIVSSPIFTHLFDPNSSREFFFQKSGFISHYKSWSATIKYNIRKTNDPILRKLSDRWKDRQTDGRTDRQKDGWTDRWMTVMSYDTVQLMVRVQNSTLWKTTSCPKVINISPWKVHNSH